MSLENKNILITAGGTGGHIYPALAVAQALRDRGANITWVGTPNSMEANIVTGKFDIRYINITGIRKKKISKRLAFPFKLTKSIFTAFKILKETKADLVIGFGGYASGPACIAAKLKNIPIIIHEQNAKMGMTNKLLSKFAKKVCLGFAIDDIANIFSKKNIEKVSITGNPVRAEIVSLNDIKKEFSTKELKLLILGGSQGAKAINDIIPDVINAANERGININVWHQTGVVTYQDTLEKYAEIPETNIKAIQPFIDDVSSAYNWADIIICRSGALTVSESAISGVTAIFIPLPSAVDDHQYFNAKNIVDNNAGFCIRQNEVSVDKILNIITNLTNDNNEKLVLMSNNAKKTLIKDSTAQILNCVNEII